MLMTELGLLTFLRSVKFLNHEKQRKRSVEFRLNFCHAPHEKH